MKRFSKIFNLYLFLLLQLVGSFHAILVFANENDEIEEANNRSNSLKINFTLAPSIANGELTSINYDSSGKEYGSDFQTKFPIKNVAMLNGILDLNLTDAFALKIAGGLNYTSKNSSKRNFDLNYLVDNYKITENGTIEQDASLSKIRNLDLRASYGFFDLIKVGVGYRLSSAKWLNKYSYNFQSSIQYLDNGSYIPRRTITPSTPYTSIDFKQEYETIFRAPYLSLDLEKSFFNDHFAIGAGGAYSNMLQIEENYQVFLPYLEPLGYNQFLLRSKFNGGQFINFSTQAKLKYKDATFGVAYVYDQFLGKAQTIEHSYYDPFLGFDQLVSRKINMTSQQISLLFGYQFNTSFYLD